MKLKKLAVKTLSLILVLMLLGGQNVFAAKATIEVKGEQKTYTETYFSGYEGAYGGAFCVDTAGGKKGELILTGKNVVFDSNTSIGFKTYSKGGAIYIGGDSIATITDGAKFINNNAYYRGGAIFINVGGTANLIANTNNIEFTGNIQHNYSDKQNVSNAIFNQQGTINLLASANAQIIFNDNLDGSGSTLNINKEIEGYSGIIGEGKIIINAKCSSYNSTSGNVNIYGGILELGKNGTWFSDSCNVNIDAKRAVYLNMANGVVQKHKFKNIDSKTYGMGLTVDADLKNKAMDTMSAESCNGSIFVTKINIIGDSKGTTDILFTASESPINMWVGYNKTANSVFYNYNVEFDKKTGVFTFTNVGINMEAISSAVAGSVGGYATQATIVNQSLASISTKVSNKKSANVQSSNLYASTANQVFAENSSIERGLWLRPFAVQETIKLNNVDIDNSLYGTLAGIDFPVGQDKQVSFYLGYAGSKQEFDEVKTTQTGYVVGLTGMIIKDSWYLGATVNGIFNKVSEQGDGETNDFDMNMFTVGAKAGYNIGMGSKWTLEPNITLMYGIANSAEYKTSLGKIDSQSISNILVEPQVKAKLGLDNGWQPYGLVGYAANLSGKPKVKAGGQELELDSIDGYIEYGLGVNKDFTDTPWNCYIEATGRSGGRNGFAGNLGIKYKF